MSARDKRRKSYARRQLIDGRLVSPVGVHGKPGTYNNHGCRCVECTGARRLQSAFLQSRRLAATKANGGIAPVGAHDASTRRNHGCACPACRAAGSKLRRDQRARARARGAGGA